MSDNKFNPDIENLLRSLQSLTMSFESTY